MTHGWNSTAYQILNPGMRLWFSEDESAVVGFQRRGGYYLAAGAPVCAVERTAAVTAEFEAYAESQKSRVCYVCAGERLRESFAASPEHSMVALGAQPVWNPRDLGADDKGPRIALRAQLQRARNKGVWIEEVDPRIAAADTELDHILKEWLAQRRLPPMHFLVEPEVLRGEVEDRVVMVATRHDKAIAYLVAFCPSPPGKGI